MITFFQISPAFSLSMNSACLLVSNQGLALLQWRHASGWTCDDKDNDSDILRKENNSWHLRKLASVLTEGQTHQTTANS